MNDIQQSATPHVPEEFNQEAPRPDARFVLRRVYGVFDKILNVHPSRVGGKERIERCAERIWEHAQSFERLYNVHFTQDSPFFQFSSKVAVIYNRARMLGIDELDVAKSLMAEPNLFYKTSDTMTERFWGHADWMGQLDVRPPQFARLTVAWPNVYSYPKESLQQRFALCLALTETPLFKLRGFDSLTFEQRRDYILLKRPMMMGKGLDNYLLRLAHVELNGRDSKPSSAIIRGDRATFEREVVAALGHDPDEKKINIKGPFKGVARSQEIQESASHYIQTMTTDILERPDDNTQRAGLSVISTLLPEKWLPRQRAQRLLLKRMLELKMLKSYRAAP